MEILAGKVDWGEGHDSYPNLDLLVDRFPELRYRKVPAQGGHLYYGESSGYVNFYFHNNNERGFSGRTFVLLMEDDTGESVVGPWSSRSGAVNSIGLGPCVDVSMTEKLTDYNRGWTFYAGACALDLVNRNIAKIDIGRGFRRHLSSGETHPRYTPVTFPEGSYLYMIPTLSYDDIIYVPAVKYPNGEVWVKREEYLENHEDWLEQKMEPVFEVEFNV
jgi:hypothetical protein